MDTVFPIQQVVVYRGVNIIVLPLLNKLSSRVFMIPLIASYTETYPHSGTCTVSTSYKNIYKGWHYDFD